MQGHRELMWAPATLPPGLGARKLVIQTPQPATEDQGGPHRREWRRGGGRWWIKWMSHTHWNTNAQHWSLSGRMPSWYTLITGTSDHERAGPLACAPHTWRLHSSHMAFHSRDRSSTMGWKGRRKTWGLCRGRRLSSNPLRCWEEHPDIMHGNLAPMKT